MTKSSEKNCDSFMKLWYARLLSVIIVGSRNIPSENTENNRKENEKSHDKNYINCLIARYNITVQLSAHTKKHIECYENRLYETVAGVHTKGLY